MFRDWFNIFLTIIHANEVFSHGAEPVNKHLPGTIVDTRD
jgi:hypothetical protein